MDKIVELIRQDPVRVAALKYVFQLGLPQCYVAAGFVRNLVWDSLHHVQKSTPLNDVDVIYFDPDERHADVHLTYEAKLMALMPALNWQVRNQAFMHERNGDLPYRSCLDAMSYWPERETAVAIRQVSMNEYECISAFGFDSLFNLQVTHNPKRRRDVFEHRIKSKQWLLKWPELTVVS
ncbi:nucleotidyltransferase family protein [Vibrio sp.]|uniref:nucleotidyltransferase family protein n=1 Tax=Vibrio sp. TaxID=678 RepID=UPI003D0FC91E